MHSAGDLVMCSCDCNGDVSRNIDGFNRVRGGLV